MYGKVLVHHNGVGVAALRDPRGRVLLRISVGENRVRAVLLLALLKTLAGGVAVHHAAHTHPVTRFKPRDLGTHGLHHASDFVPRHLGVLLRPPVALHLVDVGVANTGIADVDQNVVFTDRLALE